MLNEIGLSRKGPFAWSLNLWITRSRTAGMLDSIMCMASGVQYRSEGFSLTRIRVSHDGKGSREQDKIS